MFWVTPAAERLIPLAFEARAERVDVSGGQVQGSADPITGSDGQALVGLLYVAGPVFLYPPMP